MDSIDRELVEVLRRGLPVSRDPHADLASKVGLSLEEVRSRLRRLHEAGIIRRFGVQLDFQRLGVASLLAAFEVPQPLVEEFCRLASEREFVSHCYERETSGGWRFNVFCVVHAKSLEECEERVRTLSRLGARSFIAIPAKESYAFRSKERHR